MSTRPRCLGKSLAEQVAVKISTFPPAPQEMNTLRTQCGQLYAYDWISVPLVYTQVRTRPARLPLWKTEARKTQEAACEGKRLTPGVGPGLGRLSPGPSAKSPGSCLVHPGGSGVTVPILKITETQSHVNVRVRTRPCPPSPKSPLSSSLPPPFRPGGDRGSIQLLPGLPRWAAVSEPSQGLPWPRDGPRCPCLHIPAVLLLCRLAEGEPPGSRLGCGHGWRGSRITRRGVSNVGSRVLEPGHDPCSLHVFTKKLKPKGACDPSEASLISMLLHPRPGT